MKKQFLKSKPIVKVTFELPKEAAENANKVLVVGDFNNWNKKKGFPLNKLKNGNFKAVIELEKGKEYQFRYLIDGESWENDWEADKYVETPYGVENSVVVA